VGGAFDEAAESFRAAVLLARDARWFAWAVLILGSLYLLVRAWAVIGETRE
jgi:hypothetical protein